MNVVAKRIVMWIVVAGMTAIGLLIAFTPRAVPVDWITVERNPMMVTVDEEGQTRIHDVFVLSAPVSGRVQRINAHVGDTVVAGETVLTRIEPGDPSLLDPRSEAQARAAVQAAESAHELAAAEVERATAELEFAQAELRRAHDLVVDGTISQRALDDSERAQKTAKATLATGRAALQMRLFELDQAKAQLLSPTQTQLAHTECECVPITAPISGRVLKIANQSERVVDAGEALLEIGDPSDLEIVVDFLSTDAVQMRPGQRVVIDGWGGHKPLAGHVHRVEPFGYTKVSALGIEEQRVNVRVDFDGVAEERSELGHGYQVEARVVLWESEATIAVPLTALFRIGQEWAVFVERGGRAMLQPVQVGQKNGLVAQIVNGLDVGDTVVTHPSDRVVNGVRIRKRGTG